MLEPTDEGGVLRVQSVALGRHGCHERVTTEGGSPAAARADAWIQLFQAILRPVSANVMGALADEAKPELVQAWVCQYMDRRVSRAVAAARLTDPAARLRLLEEQVQY